jgi:predicted kinase
MKISRTSASPDLRDLSARHGALAVHCQQLRSQLEARGSAGALSVADADKTREELLSEVMFLNKILRYVASPYLTKLRPAKADTGE